jgi:hypothetical protein
MLYLTIMVITIILMILNEKFEWYNYHEVILGLSAMFFVFSIIGFIVVFIDARTDVPYLKAQAKSIETLQNNVEQIKNTYFETKKTSGQISIDVVNTELAKQIASFVQAIAEQKADYNRYVQDCRNQKEYSFYYWLGRGAFLPDEILEMGFIK